MEETRPEIATFESEANHFTNTPARPLQKSHTLFQTSQVNSELETTNLEYKYGKSSSAFAAYMIRSDKNQRKIKI